MSTLRAFLDVDAQIERAHGTEVAQRSVHTIRAELHDHVPRAEYSSKKSLPISYAVSCIASSATDDKTSAPAVFCQVRSPPAPEILLSATQVVNYPDRKTLSCRPTKVPPCQTTAGAHFLHASKRFTSNAAGKAFFDMLGVFAEFETNLRRERQMEGITKAKAAGVYKGRPPTIDVEAVRKLRAEGKGVNVISHTLKISRASVYRALGSSPSTGNGCISA